MKLTRVSASGTEESVWTGRRLWLAVAGPDFRIHPGGPAEPRQMRISKIGGGLVVGLFHAALISSRSGSRRELR